MRLDNALRGSSESAVTAHSTDLDINPVLCLHIPHCYLEVRPSSGDTMALGCIVALADRVARGQEPRQAAGCLSQRCPRAHAHTGWAGGGYAGLQHLAT